MFQNRKTVAERVARLTFFVEAVGEASSWLAIELQRRTGLLDERRDVLVIRLSGHLSTQVNLYEVTLGLLEMVARDERFAGKVRYYAKEGRNGQIREIGLKAVKSAISVA